MSSGDQGFFDRDLDVKRSGVRFYRVVGCENSCCFPEGAVIQSMDCRELDDLTLFG